MVLVMADIVFVNRIVFQVSIYIHVEFTFVQYIGERTMGDISKSLENINDVYYRRGVYVETFHMDREFENLRKWKDGREINPGYDPGSWEFPRNREAD